MRGVAILFALCGCGRIAFDATRDDGGAVDGDPSTGDGGGTGDGSTRDGPVGQVPAPIMWFKLDENGGSAAYDSVLTSDWGLVQGGTWVTGRSGAALAFDGDGDNVGIGANARLANLPRLTVSAWISPASLIDDGQPHCVFAKATTTAAGWAVLVNQNGNGSLGFETYYAATMAVATHSAPVLAAAQWQHVVATWDGTVGGHDLYRNGAPLAAIQTGTASVARPDDAAISATINCYGIVGFAGAIDEIKIFDVVLTPQEVASLYAM